MCGMPCRFITVSGPPTVRGGVAYAAGLQGFLTAGDGFIAGNRWCMAVIPVSSWEGAAERVNTPGVR